MRKTMILKILGFILTSLIIIGCDMSYKEAVVPVDALTPVIIGQPSGGSIDTETEQSFTMTVTADSIDGDESENIITYQWYSYTRYTEYENHTGKLIQGATDTSYTASFTGEGIYHFYVIVTNSNRNATGRKNISIRSEPVTVVVNDSKNARYPIITKQPTGGQPTGGIEVFLGPNMTVDQLEVIVDTGENTEGGSSYQWNITYQWYESTTPTNDSGALIESGTIKSFNPTGRIQELNELGDYYYFVVVTNTDYNVTGRRVSSVVSNPVFIRVSRNPNAAIPEITDQPSGEIYFIGDQVIPLMVTAESIDGGTLSYQWYSNTTSSNKNGTEIQGATARSYTPAINTDNTDTNERYYYYVIVTNTNTYAANPTSTVNSKAVELIVISPSTDALKNPNATISIDLNEKY